MVTYESLIHRKDRLAIVGLGYVGLPLAVAMSRHFDVVGYDLKVERIAELQTGLDKTLEVSREELAQVKVQYTSNPEDLDSCRFLIVAVPTPIDQYRIPDLNPLKSASQTVGRHLSKGSCVVYESTVYPGATEEVCIPILEKASGLLMGRDFTVGYSPERINPGDRQHRLESIVKI
ncbi:MAG: GDP-mannose dehydrogenase, partial [Desulfobacterales bacterium CG23_combo_of_CG06-09_8_20_14_all_52_9]